MVKENEPWSYKRRYFEVIKNGALTYMKNALCKTHVLPFQLIIMLSSLKWLQSAYFTDQEDSNLAVLSETT